MPIPDHLQGKVHYKKYNGVWDCLVKIVKKRTVSFPRFQADKFKRMNVLVNDE